MSLVNVSCTLVLLCCGIACTQGFDGGAHRLPKQAWALLRWRSALDDYFLRLSRLQGPGPNCEMSSAPPSMARFFMNMII